MHKGKEQREAVEQTQNAEVLLTHNVCIADHSTGIELASMRDSEAVPVRHASLHRQLKSVKKVDYP
jgi:hypothetical protein